ncbi:MAG TPA: DUF2062 domain-containing protein [Steroidobacteraceae bacterium]|nr:DUF2062 domain-containing protein [Steroidobacteraceae bacterium]
MRGRLDPITSEGMPRRVFKRLSRRRHLLQSQWFLRPFQRLLTNPAYWSLNRRNVTRAFALGLAVSFIPLPIHVVLAALLALLFGLNVPAAIAAVFFTNPLTVVPLFFLAYWVGAKLLGTPLVPFKFELSWEWLTTGLLPVWKPFLLGCLVLGLATAAIGYVLLSAIWHVSVVIKYRKRKRDALGKTAVIEQKEEVE